MSLEDEFLGCGETPVWLPRTDFHIDAIQLCRSCTIKLTAKIAGPGNVTAAPEGLTVNENPTVTLTYNSKQHNLIHTTMTFRGTHRLAELTQPSDAELLFYFQNFSEYNKIICLSLPLVIGQSASNKYFETMGTDITKNREPATSLFDKNAVFFTYRGADLRGRNADNTRPRDRCDPVKSIITYILSSVPATIGQNDYNRLLQISGGGREYCNRFKGTSVEQQQLMDACMKAPYKPSAGGPARPLAEVTVNRFVKLASRVVGISLEDSNSYDENTPSGGVSTQSMKCYKLDPSKDIFNDKVYVGGKNRPHARSLQDELNDAATGSSGMDIDSQDKSSIKPRDIEAWIGVILGLVIGAVVCATVIVFVWRGTFKNYIGVQKLYNVPVSAGKLTSALPELPALPKICPPPK